MRLSLISGTAVAALLLSPAVVLAQTPAAQVQQVPAGVQQQIEQAERSLQQIAPQLTNVTDAQRPQIGQTLRTTLANLQQALGQVPSSQRSPQYLALTRELTQATTAVANDRFDLAKVRTEVQGLVAAISPYRATLVHTDTTTATTATPDAQANIVVSQPAASVQVRQPQPIVSVQQGQPVVNVVVPPPEIIVRQPPPIVTVQIPQPTVNVQMEQPQVAVQQGRPEVQVQQTQPQVDVTATQQPQVRFTGEQPRVVVQQSDQAKVTVEKQGEAQVRVEQSDTRTAAVGPTAETRTAQTTANPATLYSASVPASRVQNLIGTNLVTADGRNAGEVENLLLDRAGAVRAAVVEWGGFLGIGARRAAVPINNIEVGSDGKGRLAMSREQLEQLGEYNARELSRYGEGVRLAK